MEATRDVIEGAIRRARESFEPAAGTSGALAEAWLAHVLETSEAVLLLNTRGFGAVAAPMRRSVVKHAVWLSWVSRHRDEADDVVRAKYRKSVKLNEDVLRSWGAWSPEKVDRALDIEQRSVPTMKDLIRDLVDTATDRAIFPEVGFGAYWLDCEQSHPSLGTAARHASVASAQWDAMLGAGLVLALRAYSSLLPDNPWDSWIRDVITALAASIGHDPDALTGR